MGEFALQIWIPDLSVVITYDVIVDHIEEDLIMDATVMHYAVLQLKFDTQELIQKDKVINGVARVN